MWRGSAKGILPQAERKMPRLAVPVRTIAMSIDVKYVTSPDGTAICAEETGDRSAPAVVFIHGLACTAAGFDNQFNDSQLSSNLHLVRYEMRGHGRSDKPEDMQSYSAIRHAEDFHSVCEAFQLDRPFVLGWYVKSTYRV